MKSKDQHPNYRGAKGEEEKQEIKNLFENIMKQNFCNVSKEIDSQEAQEAQRVPKKFGPRKHIPKAHHNYISQD